MAFPIQTVRKAFLRQDNRAKNKVVLSKLLKEVILYSSVFFQCLLDLELLQILYLHANKISDITEVHKLSALEHLKKLTLHGNDIETMAPGQKVGLLYML